MTLMSEKQNQLAEKIAALIGAEKTSNDRELFSALESINRRLDKIEDQISGNTAPETAERAPNDHPSKQKFSSLEEIADELIAGLRSEKACPYEPAGKPCDHCSMCNSLGF